MNYSQKKSEDILKEFGVQPETGLTNEQVKIMREKYGVNQFTRAKQKSILERIFEALREPMILLLILAVFITIGVNLVSHFTGGEFDFIEVIGISVAILLSTGITVIMEGKSASAFEALNNISKDINVRVIREGKIIIIPQNELVVGDICFFETGDKLPADLRIIKSNQLASDESSLTGESEAVKKNECFIAENDKIPVAERKNMIYGGCYITDGNCTAVVTAVGDDTQFGAIARELSAVKSTMTPLQEKLAKLSKTITIIGSSLAFLVFLIQLVFLFIRGNFGFTQISDAFITSIVLIVASVPEGLPTIVAVSLAINVIKMAKENALVKKLVACETLGGINVICSDKTGTLTENKMTVIDAYTAGEFKKPNEISDEHFVNNIAINSTANIENGNYIGNATECAMISAIIESGREYKTIRSNAVIENVYSFTSQTKNMTTVVKNDETYIAYSKGSPEKIILQCGKTVKNGKIIELTEEIIQDLEDKIRQFQINSCRLIALCHKELSKKLDYENDREIIESNMIFDGFVAIKDPLRREVYEAVSKCTLAGINLKMLTGDNIITAKAIALDLGMLTKSDRAVEAAELEDLTDEELANALNNIKVVARSTPYIKMRIVNALRDKGNVVAVTGDGINDAPALKNADIGIAMGITGTEVSKEAADIVLLDDSFATIVKSVRWGRGIYENFKRFIQFQLTVNLSSVAVVLTSVLIGIKSPFTALQLLWINIIMDGPPALTLGLEPIGEDLLNRPPTERNSSIVTKDMLITIITSGLFISGVFLSQYIFNFLNASEADKYSVLFTLFVTFQLFNAFNSRILDNSSIFKSFASNKLMLAVFAGTFLLQIIITQFGGEVFKTSPLSLIMWIKIIATAFSVVIFSELVRFFRKLKSKE